jgi:hypothetical protein
VRLRFARTKALGRLRLGSGCYLRIKLFLDGPHVVKESFVLGQIKGMLEGCILLGGAMG